VNTRAFPTFRQAGPEAWTATCTSGSPRDVARSSRHRLDQRFRNLHWDDDGVKFRDLKSAVRKARLKLVGRRRDPSPVVRNFSALVKRMTEQFTRRAARGEAMPGRDTGRE
jgi:hypothetical protein